MIFARTCLGELLLSTLTIVSVRFWANYTWQYMPLGRRKQSFEGEAECEVYVTLPRHCPTKSYREHVDKAVTFGQGSDVVNHIIDYMFLNFRLKARNSPISYTSIVMFKRKPFLIIRWFRLTWIVLGYWRAMNLIHDSAWVFFTIRQLGRYVEAWPETRVSRCKQANT